MILLAASRGYAGYLPATIAQFQTSEELVLVNQGLGTASAGPVTPGNVITSKTSGRVGIAAAGTSVVISNPAIDANSKVYAYLSNAAADTTALYITRITCTAGTCTINVNAATTAAVSIDWALMLLAGDSPVVA